MSQLVPGGDDIAFVEALRILPVSGTVMSDEVAGIVVEAQTVPAVPAAVAEVSVSALATPTAVAPTPVAGIVVEAQTVPAVPAVPTAVPPAPVPAAPTVAPQPRAATYGERGHNALAMVGFSPASVGYSISFLPGRDGHLGLTYTTERRIEIYIRPSMSASQIAYIIGHELGHAVDHIRNSSADRQRWMEARGIAPTAAWWPTGLGSDLSTPAGDFAECFASWSVGSPSHSAWGGCGGQMSLMGELAAG